MKPITRKQHSLTRRKSFAWFTVALLTLIAASTATLLLTRHNAPQYSQYSYKVSGVPKFVDPNAPPFCRSADAAAAAKAERDNLPYPKVDNPAFCSQPIVCKDRKLLVSYDRDSLLTKQDTYVYLATDNGSSIGSVWVTPNGEGATPVSSEITGFAFTPNSTAKFKISGDVISTYQYGFFNGQEGISKVHIQLDITNECDKYSQTVTLSDAFTPSKDDVANHTRRANQTPTTEPNSTEQE